MEVFMEDRTFLFLRKGLLLGAALFLYACSTEAALQDILGESTEAPVFLSCRAHSPQEIKFLFSQPVTLSSLRFDPPITADAEAQGDTVVVTLETPLESGIRIVADMVVEDYSGNTLNVLVPFRSRNENLPPLLITEIRTEYSKPKVEFVEFKTLDAGDLGALRLFIAGTSLETPVLEFPPAKVGAGEYVVVHLRSLDPENRDETAGDPGENPYSKDNEALAEAWDFWVPGTTKRIKKTDALFFMDQDDRIIDAVLLSENADPWWNTEYMVQAAELLETHAAWTGESAADGQIPGPDSAVISKNTTATRSISRDETIPDSNSAADWYITASSNATPGKVNSTKRYVPK
jgi:hypothetical protein